MTTNKSEIMPAFFDEWMKSTTSVINFSLDNKNLSNFDIEVQVLLIKAFINEFSDPMQFSSSGVADKKLMSWLRNDSDTTSNLLFLKCIIAISTDYEVEKDDK